MKTAVEWLVDELSLKSKALKIMLNAHKEIIEQAKEMDREQKKQLVIGTYIDLKMKNNNLAFGMEYISKVGKLEKEAEQYYNKTFKQNK
jgi:hypothetical protein